MAAVNGVKAATATLVAATVDTVTLSGAIGGLVEITHHGTVPANPLYFRLDGTNPVTGALENFVVLSGQSARVRLPGAGANAGIVKIISAGANVYSVTEVLETS